MKKKQITTEDLARMVQEGFSENKEQVQNLETWAKGRFDNLDQDLLQIRKQLTGPQMTREFEQLLGSIEGDIKNKRNLSSAFALAKEMDEHLNTLCMYEFSGCVTKDSRGAF